MKHEGPLFDLKVHPAAEVFPMLGDDELRDLAEDIKANGLIHPIVLDKDGVLIDGRNRLAACNLAGVEPEFETLNGHDPVAFILSSNIQRRQMSKGQQAAAAVLVWDVTRNMSLRQFAEGVNQNRERVRRAAVVLEYAPDLMPLVASNARHLDEAYEDARKRKVAHESDQERDARERAEIESQTERLRVDAPDLAELVAEWRMSLAEGLAALAERERARVEAGRQEHERRQRATQGFAKSTSYLHALLQSDPSRIARDWLPKENNLANIAGCEQLWTRAGLTELAHWLNQAAEVWEDRA